MRITHGGLMDLLADTPTCHPKPGVCLDANKLMAPAGLKNVPELSLSQRRVMQSAPTTELTGHPLAPALPKVGKTRTRAATRSAATALLPRGAVVRCAARVRRQSRMGGELSGNPREL
ncbi:MAG: hypothetical protein IPG50_13885 [Myxococcales bacterium]|nr:hypothetical protein [Myxococcales bacterium]